MKVLIPQSFQKFSPDLPEYAEPVYYNIRSTSFWRRLKNKLRLLDNADPWETKLCLNKAFFELDNVHVLWFSSDIVLSVKETEKLLERLPSLRWVYSQRAGIDHIPVNFYRERGIIVSNTGTLVSAWVAQMNFACIMAQSKQILELNALQRKGFAHSVFCDDFTRQSVAIIGTGNVGGETARLCKAVGMRVTGLSRDPENMPRVEYYDTVCSIKRDLDTVISESDYVVIAVPLNEQTKRLISAERLKLFKSSATLINFARPAIVDESALLGRLRSRAIAAAFVSSLQNVSWVERLMARKQSNLSITNNSEAHLKEKEKQAFRQFVELLKSFRTSGEPGNRVV